MKTIVRSLALLVVLSSSGAIAQTCPIAQPQLDGINASLLGSPPGIPAGLSTAQTMASLYGEPCISSLLSGLTYVLYDQPSYSA